MLAAIFATIYPPSKLFVEKPCGWHTEDLEGISHRKIHCWQFTLQSPSTGIVVLNTFQFKGITTETGFFMYKSLSKLKV